MTIDALEPNPYGELALRLERDLSPEERSVAVLVVPADYDRVAVEATTELAWCLAEEFGRRILMIDVSFGRSGLSRVFGAQRRTGLTEVLQAEAIDSELLARHIAPTSHPRIQYLARGAGAVRNVPLRAASARSLVAAASEFADYVLLAGPTVQRANRALVFGAIVDASLLVTLEGELRMGEIMRAHDLLSSSGAERIGLVLGAPRNHGASRL